MKKLVTVLLTLALVLCSLAPTFSEESANAAQTAFDLDGFAMPGREYRPGVRWWWAGGAPKTEDLLEQVDYLAANGFGYVEINCFDAEFMLDENGMQVPTIELYPELKADVLNYDTPEFYAKLDAVIERCNEYGIIVDLNMGSGYEASDNSVVIEDSMKNMALGRETITGVAGQAMTVAVPEIEVSSFYAMYEQRHATDIGTYDPDTVKLQALVIAKIDDKRGARLTQGNVFIDPEDKSPVNAYNYQYVLNPQDVTVYTLDQLSEGSVEFTPASDADYEVIALYRVAAGSFGIVGVIDDPEHPAYVVDELDNGAIERYIRNWFAQEDLARILETRDIRAAFNDSYEFVIDGFYSDSIFENAADAENNILGYDFTPYLPTMYSLFGGAFFGARGTDQIPYTGRTNATFLAENLTALEVQRLTYDYNQLVSQAFIDGIRTFSNTLKEYGLVFRQQAYNPPIDTQEAAHYVDIPETEGLNENSLKRITSGGHVYGKELITSEEYTVGVTPYYTGTQFVKDGIDLMATSGVTNFVYHGLSSPWYGNDEQKAAFIWGEEGWHAWPTIGITAGETEPLHIFYNGLNDYAARIFLALRSGVQSSDVAVYMPLFGGITEDDVAKTLNNSGYVWDVMGDVTIQDQLKVEDGRLVVTESGMSYDALILQDDVVPVKTMEALKALADEGANIIIYGILPDRQPSYAGGRFIELDEQVTELGLAMAQLDNVIVVPETYKPIPRGQTTAESVISPELAAAVATVVSAPVSYEDNNQVRMTRRTLPTGEEIAFIRSLNANEAVTVNLTADESLANFYWLDASDGAIYAADDLTLTLGPSGAMMLLAAPEGIALPEEVVKAGLPLGIDPAEETVLAELTSFTLDVTADNIGTNRPGEMESRQYEIDALGDFMDDNFLNGELKYVAAPVTYTAQVELPAPAEGKRVVLNLGAVNYAATVTVNGQVIGQVTSKPFNIDITDAVVEGTNTVAIEVQTTRNNRRVGMRQLYEQGDDYYRYYAHYAARNLQSGGLMGPVAIVEK